MERSPGARVRRRWLVATAVLAACAVAAFVLRGHERGWRFGRAPGPERLVGKAAPELPALPTLDGKPVRLADHRGRVVLLHFWAWGCTIVDELLPRYDDWQRSLGPSGLAVVGVYAPKEGESRVRQFERLGLERPAWPLAFDARLSSWMTFGVRLSPTVFLIDREGRVRAVHAGQGIGDAIDRDLRGLFEPQRAAGP